MLFDDESETYWNHITGMAVHGPLKGTKMETWGIEISDVKTVQQQFPNIQLFQSKLNLRTRLIIFFMNHNFIQGRFPPMFRKTLGKKDLRLSEMNIGLGIITENCKRFYPRQDIIDGIRDKLNGQEIQVKINLSNKIPFAVWPDGTRPIQMFTRWYGFSYTFPGCEVYSKTK